MQLRNLTTIYVLNGDEILLIERVGSRVFQGVIWCGIGGHFEETELNDPYKCVLRELEEETGLTKNDIFDLNLRYITFRRAGEEIRQQYIFFAKLSEGAPTIELRGCDEGKLMWVSTSDLLNRKMSFTNQSCLRHYYSQGVNDDNIYVGAVSVVEDKPAMEWVRVESFSTKY